MTDYLENVNADQDPFRRILSKIPGFSGYIERTNRRDADKLLRDTLAQRFEALWQRASEIQRELLESGGLAYVDDIESAAIKLRTFADRIRNASYGYASLFESIKVNEQELARLYEYDNAMLDYVDKIGAALDNIQASIGTDGLPAAIRNLATLSREAITAFDRREEAILS